MTIWLCIGRRKWGACALDHLGFLVDSRQEVDQRAKALRSRGVPIAAEPRDPRDGSRSFYCLDPDGLRIQVLYEPALSRQKIGCPGPPLALLTIG